MLISNKARKRTKAHNRRISEGMKRHFHKEVLRRKRISRTKRRQAAELRA